MFLANVYTFFDMEMIVLKVFAQINSVVHFI